MYFWNYLSGAREIPALQQGSQILPVLPPIAIQMMQQTEPRPFPQQVLPVPLQ
jgi:hypothetical protein